MMTDKEKNRLANEIGAQVLEVVCDELEMLVKEHSGKAGTKLFTSLHSNIYARKKDLEDAAGME